MVKPDSWKLVSPFGVCNTRRTQRVIVFGSMLQLNTTLMSSRICPHTEWTHWNRCVHLSKRLAHWISIWLCKKWLRFILAASSNIFLGIFAKVAVCSGCVFLCFPLEVWITKEMDEKKDNVVPSIDYNVSETERENDTMDCAREKLTIKRTVKGMELYIERIPQKRKSKFSQA